MKSFQLFILLVSAGIFMIPAPGSGQTLSVALTPSDANGSYAAPGTFSRYCIAVWLETGGGTFVQTLGRWAGVRRSDLVTWYALAGSGDTDGVSGATIVDPLGAFPQRFVANADISGLADGSYTIRMELTDAEGATAGQNNLGSFSFTKSSTSSLQTALSNGGFSDVSIAYDAGSDSGYIVFDTDAVTVSESAGLVQINAIRWGGIAGSIGADIDTADGSALAGADYTALADTITFTDSDVTPQTFSIPIANDGAPEGNETFTVELSNYSGTSAGPLESITVTLNDPGASSDDEESGGCLPGTANGLFMLLTITLSLIFLQRMQLSS